jgi:hypothetical protein
VASMTGRMEPKSPVERENVHERVEAAASPGWPIQTNTPCSRISSPSNVSLLLRSTDSCGRMRSALKAPR